MINSIPAQEKVSALDTSDFLNVQTKDLMSIAKKNAKLYQTAEPFPNISFEHFFNPKILDVVLNEFPDLGKTGDFKYETPNEIKLASKGEHRFGSVTKAFTHFLNSEPLSQTSL